MTRALAPRAAEPRRRVRRFMKAGRDILFLSDSEQVNRVGRLLDLAALALELAPTSCPVVRDDLPEHGQQRGFVDRLPPPDGDGTGGLVVVPAGDDPLRIGHDRAVVE